MIKHPNYSFQFPHPISLFPLSNTSFLDLPPLKVELPLFLFKINNIFEVSQFASPLLQISKISLEVVLEPSGGGRPPSQYYRVPPAGALGLRLVAVVSFALSVWCWFGFGHAVVSYVPLSGSSRWCWLWSPRAALVLVVRAVVSFYYTFIRRLVVVSPGEK